MKKTLMALTLFMLIVGMQAMRRVPYESVPVTGTSDIRTQVETYIEENEISPQEPRLDPVWQFVPGLEGIKFDFEMSYQNMLSHGQFDSNLMIGHSISYEKDTENFREHRIYRGHEKSPYVGLLINVAWGGEELLQMLDILDKYQVQASIFFEGKFAEKNPELVLEVFNRGHLVGNHSYSHPAGWLHLSYEGFQEEIVRTNEILSQIISEGITFFAPPGGAFNEDTVRAAYDEGMYTILWSADTIDWRGESADILVNRVMQRITPGGLILTHPKPETVIALPEIIERVRNEGYEFRRVDAIVSGERIGHFEE